MDRIVNKILERDRVFGEICEEVEISHENENYFSVLACLFIISEQGIKHLLNKNSGNFNKLLIKARDAKKISDDEFDLLAILDVINLAPM